MCNEWNLLTQKDSVHFPVSIWVVPVWNYWCTVDQQLHSHINAICTSCTRTHPVWHNLNGILENVPFDELVSCMHYMHVAFVVQICTSTERESPCHCCPHVKYVWSRSCGVAGIVGVTRVSLCDIKDKMY